MIYVNKPAIEKFVYAFVKISVDYNQNVALCWMHLK